MSEEWPTPALYSQAIQVPRLLTAELRSWTPRSGFLAGLPQSFTGANAIVFPVDGPEGAGGLRFFTNRHAAQPGRYAALDRHCATHDVPALARCRWIDFAIQLDGTAYPALLMEWIDGVLFDQYVLQLADAGATDALRSLADDVWQLVAEMQAASLAHGDIQHGNLLVDRTTGALRLVDFDSIWVPELETSPPSEAGHPSYQHPERLSGAAWGPGIDTFAALVLRLTLTAFANDPSLRRHAVAGSHLLLSDTDLKDAGAPGGMLDLLRSSRDVEVAATATALIDTIEAPPDPRRLLDANPPGNARHPIPSGATPAAGVGSESDADEAQRGQEGQEHDAGYWWFGAGTAVEDQIGAADPDDATPDRPQPIWQFTVPETTTPTESSAPLRPLPDIGQITRQFEAPTPAEAPQSTSTDTPPFDWWGPKTHGTTAPQPPDPPPNAGATRPSASKRATAAAIDVCLGFTVVHLLYLLYAASRGETPVKRLFDLEVVTPAGDRPGFGRLAVREILSKHLSIWALAIGGATASWLLITIGAVWLVVGAAPLLGPSGRALWDVMCGTTVVGRRPIPTNATGGTRP